MSNSADHRLRRALRLRKSVEFRRVARLARREASRAFVVLWAPTVRKPESETLRLGVTVSRKVGNAVVRNRVKRLIREWFRRQRGELGVMGDIVIIARRAAAELSQAQVDRDLCEQVGRLAVGGTR